MLRALDKVRIPRIYRATFDILEAAFQLSMINTHMDPSFGRRHPLPKNVDEAVKNLVAQLSLKDKSKIARMGQRDLKLWKTPWAVISRIISACTTTTMPSSHPAVSSGKTFHRGNGSHFPYHPKTVGKTAIIPRIEGRPLTVPENPAFPWL
jgi:hypothetical protein